METKVCTGCGITKSLDQFNIGNSAKGRESRCRNCKKEWRKKNIERMKKYESSNERKLKHLLREKNRRLLKKNTDGIGRDVKTKYRIMLLEKQNYKCAITGKSLLVQGVLNYHIDHIIPLSKGGSHTINNIQLLTPEANLAKSNKIL